MFICNRETQSQLQLPDRGSEAQGRLSFATSAEVDAHLRYTHTFTAAGNIY